MEPTKAIIHQRCKKKYLNNQIKIQINTMNELSIRKTPLDLNHDVNIDVEPGVLAGENMQINYGKRNQ